MQIQSAAQNVLVLQSGVTNIVELPAGTEAIWVGLPGYHPLKEQFFSAKPVAPGKYALFIPSYLASGGPNLGYQSTPIVPFRLVRNKRLSPIRPILIDSLPRQTNLSNACGIVGVIKENEKVRLPFFVEDSSEWRFELVANRLGSQLDARMRILDSKDREVASSAKDPFSAPDPRLIFKEPRKNFDLRIRQRRYVLEVFDVTNKGGEDSFFYLRASQQVFRGDAFSYPLLIWIPESNPGGIFYDDEPNDSPSSANPLKIPTLRKGLFKTAKQTDSAPFARSDDRDWYEFNVTEGDKFIFTVETRRYGSPCDAGIKLFHSDGKMISEAVGAEADAPSITNRFSKSGLYRLEVREIGKLSGPGLFYWLTVNKANPGVMLSTEVESIDFSKEGEAKLKIACDRYDYDGPIKLKVDGLPEGVTVAEDTIAQGKKEGELRLKGAGIKEGFQIRVSGMIELEFTDKSDKLTREYPVSTMPALRKLFPMQLFPSAAMDGWIAVNPTP